MISKKDVDRSLRLSYLESDRILLLNSVKEGILPSFFNCFISKIIKILFDITNKCLYNTNNKGDD